MGLRDRPLGKYGTRFRITKPPLGDHSFPGADTPPFSECNLHTERLKQQNEHPEMNGLHFGQR